MPGGRPKGSPNKSTVIISDLAAKLGVNPIEIMLLVAKGDWQSLGYEKESLSRWTNAGIEYEEPVISLESRLAAAKAVSKFLYAERKAVDVNLSEPIHVVVEEWK